MGRDENPYLGVGIYGVSEAAMLTSVSPQRIRRWLHGYRYQQSGRIHELPPVWQPQLPRIHGRLALSFLDLIEVRFVDAFRQYGVSWQTIRKAAERAQSLLGSDHPFSTHRFKTDGRSIFAEVVAETGEAGLIDVVKNQLAFRKILQPYLYRGLQFDKDDLLVCWWPLGRNHKVVIDPGRAFGQPIVSREGIPTRVLANAYRAEQSIERVAGWYEAQPSSVRAAVEFEERPAA